MKWQTADWFFVAIVLVFVAVIFVSFVRRGRHGAHRDEGKSDRRPPRAEGEEPERPGPTINM